MMPETPHNCPVDRVAALWVQGCGKSEIGRELGYDPRTIRGWLELPEVQEEIERIQTDARAAAKRMGASLVGRAAKVWAGALEATSGDVCAECGKGLPDHAIRLRAADSVADRFGIPKTEVQEVVAALTMVDKDDAAIESEVLTEAATILDRLGRHELAAGIREIA